MICSRAEMHSYSCSRPCRKTRRSISLKLSWFVFVFWYCLFVCIINARAIIDESYVGSDIPLRILCRPCISSNIDIISSQVSRKVPIPQVESPIGSKTTGYVAPIHAIGEVPRWCVGLVLSDLFEVFLRVWLYGKDRMSVCQTPSW